MKYLRFLSLDDPAVNVPGNAGLKDQVLALKWVKDNCEAFGGDPNNITVFGESAGGASAHFMMLTERTKNLFHKAIAMSGSALTSWATVPRHDWAFRLAKLCGYKDEQDNKKIFNYLKSMKGKKILQAEMVLLNTDERKNRILFPFGPTIEPYLTEDCVIPKEPRELMKTAWGNEIPMMIGGTSSEGLFSYPETQKHPHILRELKNCEYLVPYELKLDRESELCKEYGLRIKKAHFGDKEPGDDTPFEYTDLLSYKYFWHGIHRTLLSRLEYASAPTFLYRFDFDSPFFNHIRVYWCGRNLRGTCHGDDLSYIFLNAISENLEKTSMEYRIIQKMVGMLLSFARDGQPHHTDFDPKTWKPVSKDVRPFICLNIGDDLELMGLPEAKKLEVWDSLYPKEILY